MPAVGTLGFERNAVAVAGVRSLAACPSDSPVTGGAQRRFDISGNESRAARGAGIDVAIIGAGAAGIAAGRYLAVQGCKVRLFEASDYIGGRALTRKDTLGVPFDYGAAWLHCADRNPLRPFADAHGIGYVGNPDVQYHLNGHWLDPNQRADVRERLREANAIVDGAGRAGRDVVAATLLCADDPIAPVRDYMMTAINAVPPSEYATGDAGHEEDTGEDWLVRDGFGRLIHRLAAGLDIVCNTPVRTVACGDDGVRLVTDDEAVDCTAAIVTVSTGVLRAGDLHFDPPLPARRRAALEQVPMGVAEKIGLRFDRAILGLADNTFVVIEHEGRVLGFQIQPGDPQLVIAYAGGPDAAAWLAQSEADAIDEVTAFLSHAAGHDVRPYRLAAVRTGWRDYTWTRGSYSAAVPGGYAAREELAVPLHGRLLFAGEATHPTRFTAVHGAWDSGERAAREALAILGTGRS